MTRTTAAPPARPLVGHLHDLRRDPLGFTARCADYGDVVPLRFGPNRVFMLNHPDDIEDVLVTRNHLFRKGYLARGLEPMIGNGLLISEGDFWRRQRRLEQPAFHRTRIAGYAASMVAEVEPLTASWRDGEERDVHADMLALTLEVVTRTLFGADVREHVPVVREALATVLTTLNYRLSTLLFMLPTIVPVPAHLRLRAAMSRLDRIVYGIIERRRRSGERRADLLGMLLDAKDEDGARMTDRQLRDEVMTLMVAGHETTALSLSWSSYLLAAHPTAEAALHRELEAVLGGRPPAVDDLPRLRFADAAVKETLRLYPPGWVIFREALEDLEIRGHAVRRGWTVALPQWAVHRSGRFHPEPERFRPERWLDDDAGRHRFAYFPFGGGPRLCIGSHFAMLESTLLLAAIAQRFRFRTVPGSTPEPDPAITLRPRSGIQLTVHARG